MQFHMYLPDADRPENFIITDDRNTPVLKTTSDGLSWNRLITNPAGDMTMLKVRYSSVFGDSFVFSDVTGNRGTYHVKGHTALIDMHMMTGRWDLRYYKPEGTVTVKRLDKVVAEASIDPDYALYFHIDLKDSAELLFTVGSLVAVSYYLL